VNLSLLLQYGLLLMNTNVAAMLGQTSHFDAAAAAAGTTTFTSFFCLTGRFLELLHVSRSTKVHFCESLKQDFVLLGCVTVKWVTEVICTVHSKCHVYVRIQPFVTEITRKKFPAAVMHSP